MRAHCTNQPSHSAYYRKISHDCTPLSGPLVASKIRVWKANIQCTPGLNSSHKHYIIFSTSNVCCTVRIWDTVSYRDSCTPSLFWKAKPALARVSEENCIFLSRRHIAWATKRGTPSKPAVSMRQVPPYPPNILLFDFFTCCCRWSSYRAGRSQRKQHFYTSGETSVLICSKVLLHCIFTIPLRRSCYC